MMDLLLVRFVGIIMTCYFYMDWMINRGWGCNFFIIFMFFKLFIVYFLFSLLGVNYYYYYFINYWYFI
jgi:hypothetical protein